MEKASLLAEDALQAVLGEIRPGMEETELAGRLDYAFRQRGAQRNSFDTIVLFGRRQLTAPR
ncbi:MAG: M24 family metallopeptidase [Acutalibacteraceae bacterium]